MSYKILLCCLLLSGPVVAEDMCDHVKSALKGHAEHRCAYDNAYGKLTIDGTASPRATLKRIPVPIGNNVTTLEINKLLRSLSLVAFDNFNSLESLTLLNNSIKQFPAKTFSNLNSLKWLYLYHNQIETAVPFAELPRNLKTASFSHNRIKRLTRIKDLPEGLTTLDMDHNRLTSFIMDSPAQSSGNYSLATLNLRGNRIKDYYTPALSKLKFLSLTGNMLIEVPSDMLEGLGKLEQLYLAENIIELIEQGAFVHTPELELLSLSDNRIRMLDEHFSLPLPKLAELFVDGNRLQYLHLSLFIESPKLERMLIHGNPYNCGCLENALMWIRSYNVTISCRGHLSGDTVPGCIVHSGDNIHYCLYKYYEDDVKNYLDNRYTKLVNSTIIRFLPDDLYVCT